jgi:hypothetical protein
MTGLRVVARHLESRGGYASPAFSVGRGRGSCQACAGASCEPLLAGAGAAVVLGGALDSVLRCTNPAGAVRWVAETRAARAWVRAHVRAARERANESLWAWRGAHQAGLEAAAAAAPARYAATGVGSLRNLSECQRVLISAVDAHGGTALAGGALLSSARLLHLPILPMLYKGASSAMWRAYSVVRWRRGEGAMADHAYCKPPAAAAHAVRTVEAAREDVLYYVGAPRPEKGQLRFVEAPRARCHH